jgi:hypothetical protein
LPDPGDDTEGAIRFQEHGGDVFQRGLTVLPCSGADVSFGYALPAHRFVEEFAVAQDQYRMGVHHHARRASMEHDPRHEDLEPDEDRETDCAWAIVVRASGSQPEKNTCSSMPSLRLPPHSQR